MTLLHYATHKDLFSKIIQISRTDGHHWLLDLIKPRFKVVQGRGVFFHLKFKYLSGQRLLCLRNFSLIYIKPPVTECDVEILLELCPFLVSFRGQGEKLKVHFVCLLCWELPRLVLFSISHRRMEIRMEFTLPPAYVLPIASLFSFNEIVQCSQCTCKSK